MSNKKLKVHFSYKSIFLIIFAVALVAIDLITKTMVERYDVTDFDILTHGFIHIDAGHHNTGMAFSALEGKDWAQAFLIGFSVLMIAVIIVLILFIPERFTLLKTSLYMILAGAIGNLIDRMTYGYVRDFIFIFITQAYCNFADICIVIGTILAIIDLLFLNEVSIFPMTKKARAIQEEKRRKEKEMDEAEKREEERRKQQRLLEKEQKHNKKSGGDAQK